MVLVSHPGDRALALDAVTPPGDRHREARLRDGTALRPGSWVQCVAAGPGSLPFGAVGRVETVSRRGVRLALATTETVVMPHAEAVARLASARVGLLRDRVDCHYASMRVLVILRPRAPLGVPRDVWYVCTQLAPRVTVLLTCGADGPFESPEGAVRCPPVWDAFLRHLSDMSVVG